MVLIGLIADTHGYLGHDVGPVFAGCDLIVHAGDVGPAVIAGLEPIAPVAAVRGNNDASGPESLLPVLLELELAGRRVTVVHRIVDAPREGFDVLVYGHCHKRHADFVDGRWLLNPGAAGKRGFHTARSVALLRLEGESVSCDFVELGARAGLR